MLNQEWGNVDDVIRKMQWYPLHVHGNVFCFIYLPMESLSHDHKITLEFNQIYQLILNHLCYENDKYLNFYTKRSVHSFVTTSDLMMEEVIRFFDFGNFNVNIVYLLIQIAADALNLDIIQNSEGIVQILKVPGGNFTKKVYLNTCMTTSIRVLITMYPSSKTRNCIQPNLGPIGLL